MDTQKLIFTDDVRGNIVGDITNPYEFWKAGRRIGRGHFANDQDAESYCKEHFPADYDTGIEMRRFE